MNPRQAMFEVLTFILTDLEYDDPADLARQMHDDYMFLEDFKEFMKDHLDIYEDNYDF